LLTLADNTIILLFILLLVGVGYFFSKKISNLELFYLAGRKLPWFITVGTISATWFGASGTIGAVEMGFTFGLSSWFIWCFTAYLSRIPLALIVGPRIQMTTGLTIPDILRNKYGKLISVFIATLMFICMIQITEIMAINIIGKSAWNIDGITLGIIIVGLSVLLAVLGGLLSVAITDMIFFFCMFFGLVMALPNIWHSMSGIDGITNGFQSMDVSYFQDVGGLENYLSVSGGLKPSRAVVLILISMSVYCNPLFYQRFSAADSKKSAGRSLLVCLVVWLAFDFAMIMLGMLTKLTYPDMNPGEAYIKMMLSYLPVGLRALFIIGAVGSIVSTLNSCYLTAGVTLTNDIIEPFFKKRRLSQRALIVYSRLGIVFIGVLGILASRMFDMVIDAYIFVSSAWVSGAMVPIITAFFWRGKRTITGAWLSSIGGLGTFSVLRALGIGDTLLYALPVSIICFAIGTFIGKDLRKKEMA